MTDITVNPFFLIEIVEEKGEQRSVNQIFGIPRWLSKENWPIDNGAFLHHLITIETKHLKLPISRKPEAMSIFFKDAKESKSSNASSILKFIFLFKNDLKENSLQVYPKSYIPWWSKDLKNSKSFENGVTFNMRQIKELSLEFIRNVLIEKEKFDFKAPLDKLRGENSFIGGFPMWVQEDETPLDQKGNNASYLLMLNGFNKLFETSPFEGFDLFIFMDTEGNPYFISQR